MFAPGTLWSTILERTGHALKCGAIQSIATQTEHIEQEGIQFLIRIVSNIALKAEARENQQRQTTGSPPNPFLPYHPDLFVADISDSHVCLLNKFNVVDHHILMITRTFEDQESLLTLPDFTALWRCMVEFDGLAFYNAGEIAGASQRHKHLQMVPLPLGLQGPSIPIGPLMETASFQHGLGNQPRLPFIHSIARVHPRWLEAPEEGAKRTLDLYRDMLHAVNVPIDQLEGGKTRIGPYNLLVTRQWMLLAPRSKEMFETISVNALGFAGAFLVKNRQEMCLLKERGPLQVLKHVGVERDSQT